MSPSVSFETLEQKVCYWMLFLNIISKFLEKCINLSAIRTDKNRCGDVCYKMKTHQIPAAVLYHVSPKKRKKKNPASIESCQKSDSCLRLMKCVMPERDLGIWKKKVILGML